jgi:serine/threonine-protein kinase
MSQRFGNYVLHETLNEGGMTQIWLATDPNDQVVALRRLHTTSSGSSAPKLFRTGLKVMRKLPRHPNVVGLRDHGKFRGIPFMVLDYINGANLKQLALRHDTVIDENVSDVIIGMADALEHLHDHGWIHLDFKPENVMVDLRGHPYLIDFDTARAIPRRPKKSARTSGTPSHMAPEQLKGEPHDQRADIYAFGVTAYELLTHRRPFQGRNPTESRRLQLDENYRPAPPSKFNPGVPHLVNRIILQCLAHNPDQRYPNMTLLNVALHRALGVKITTAA